MKPKERPTIPSTELPDPEPGSALADEWNEFEFVD